MCLIAYSPKSQVLPDDWVKSSADRNKDGFGVMWPEEGRIKIFKGMVSLERQQVILAEVAAKGVPFAMHQRMATHGPKTPKMCHPFRVLSKEHNGQDLYMMHNGVIHKMTANKDRSDTWLFVNDFLRPILAKAPGLLQKKPFQAMIAEYIGTGSKLLFMDGEGRVTIINRDQGTDRDGFWLSNTYSIYTPPKSTYYYDRKGRNYYGGVYAHGYGDGAWPDDGLGDVGDSCALPDTQQAAEKAQTPEGSKSANGVQPALPGTPPPPAKQDVSQTNQTNGQATPSGEVILFTATAAKPPLAKVEVTITSPKPDGKKIFLGGLLDWYVKPAEMGSKENRDAVIEALEKSSKGEIEDWVLTNPDTAAAFLYHRYSMRNN